MADEIKPQKSQFRGNPVFDRFFSQIVKAVHDEDGAEAYELFLKSLEKAEEGKSRLGQY